MAVLRTRLLARGLLPGPVQEHKDIPGLRAGPVYTVPADRRAIVREMRMTTSQPQSTDMAFAYVVHSGGTLTIAGAALATGGQAFFLQACDTVMNPGDTLMIGHLYTGLEYYISGAELYLPFTPTE